ncbi:hypothetical protein HPB47_004403 [Ixodes persulcatus]|uniref:Uncharacterized protein n=1 Tax=Ixodes persulcatus TaxID=34615 RepID=A0AC60PFU9_IXOPE|nr:hypothetical protein HPB47_004403 [Ixodes persulcatus]
MVCTVLNETKWASGTRGLQNLLRHLPIKDGLPGDASRTCAKLIRALSGSSVRERSLKNVRNELVLKDVAIRFGVKPLDSYKWTNIAPYTRFCKTASHKLVTDIQTKFASNVTGRNKRLVDCSRDDPSIFLIGSGPWADVVRSVMDAAVVVSKRRENSGHCGSGPSCHPGDFSLGHSRAA